MARTVRALPAPLELLCLRALWKLGGGDVKQVRELVTQSRPLAYTTVMTVLERLVRKGQLTRRKAGRLFIYSPETSRDALRRTAIRELVNGLFDGSDDDLIQFLRTQREQCRETVSAAAPPALSPGAAQTMDTVLL
jgi:BlaI family transcriptional regulator, penicillinase repressor